MGKRCVASEKLEGDRMRFPLSWLKDWVALPADLKQVQDLLMKAGAGLEAVENPGARLHKVVVAKVLAKEKHPNADKLSLCKVSDGAKEYSIVCGAQNFEAGAVVPLALEGAELGDLKIKRSKIRGVESEGMLCSGQELGLADVADGLMLLDAGLTLGMPLAQALGLDDTVLTLETTANRPDHLSLRGLGRELAALGGLQAKEAAKLLTESGAPASQGFSVASLDPAACPYYTARIVRGLKVAPSPEWLRARLAKAGLRSVNNVVDVTNYVLLELGQPLHAFDLAKLKGGRLEARLAKAGERLETLDHQVRDLSPEDIVIADSAGPQALGGVIGGAASEVAAGTTEILLEAAVFKRERVRRTSRRLGLRSDSSLSFERGVDAHALTQALDRAAALLGEVAGGQVAPGILSAGSPGAKPGAVALDLGRLSALLGLDLETAEVGRLLHARGFTMSPEGATPPTWRGDVRGSQDLAEEVLQMLGLDRVPSTVLANTPGLEADSNAWATGLRLGRLSVELGLKEASSQTYLDPALTATWGLDAAAIDNPLSTEQSLLRPSLLPNLVSCVVSALRRKVAGVAYFETGAVFSREGKGIKEDERLAVVLAGVRGGQDWLGPEQDWDYYDLKGMAERLAGALGVTFRVAAAGAKAPAWAHPGMCALVSLGGLSGALAALHPALLKRLDLDTPVLAMELEGLRSKSLMREPRFEAVSRFPKVERDLSCLMGLELEAGKVLDFLRTEGGLQGVRVKDRFEGAPLPQGKKSLTFSLTYSAPDRSLTDAEVNQLHDELSRRLEQSLPLEVRR